MPAHHMISAVWTIGHSNRPGDEFLRLLKHYDIQLLADVRKMPRSRYNPQFNSDTLAAALKQESIRYHHFADLGGMRRKEPDSVNQGWRNPSFRAYADYMLSETFAEALHHLLSVAGGERTAIMCAEAVPWRCHRFLISDALLVRGIPVIHILSETKTQPHVLADFAHVEGDRITYPSQEPQLQLDL